MSLTRAQVESVLVRRTAGYLEAASLDYTTVDGTNADLNDPIGYAIRQCGGTVASIASVTDSDLSAIDSDDTDKLIDFAELRTLETASNNFALVDYNVGPRIERLGQLGDRLQKALENKRKQVADDYGLGASTLEAGVVTMSFAETNAT